MCSRHDFEHLMFRDLDPAGAERMRAWAREHYQAGQVINELWHPVVRLEAARINAAANDAAYDIDCPACQATAGEVCVDTQVRGLAQPHAERKAGPPLYDGPRCTACGGDHFPGTH